MRVQRLSKLILILLLSTYPNILADAKPALPVTDSSQIMADAPSDPPLSYNLQCRFLPGLSLIEGQVKVTWKYPGTRPLKQIALHLYPNAFQSGSTFLNESAGQHHGNILKADQFGSIEISRILWLTKSNPMDISPMLRYIRPDDQNPHDSTLATLDLPHAIQPGETLELVIPFRTKLPKVFARSGVAGPFVMAGQWYPKMAAFELRGQRGRTEEGFNLHQYHSNSEFYADFANYEAKITVPKGYIVGATGRETSNPQSIENETTFHFVQRQVHDFAWAADPRFTVYTQTIQPKNSPPVEVRLYSQPEHQHLAGRQLNAVVGALMELASTFGPYPYSTLTVIDPPQDAPGAGGMEYPTLITGGSPLIPGSKSSDPERVLVHETAHQYWYGLVASNEFEEAWLDEGLTSYTEGKVMARLYPNTKLAMNFFGNPLIPLPVSDHTPGLFRSILTPWVPDPVQLPSWEFASDRSYGSSVYYRAALILFSLEKQIGEAKMQEVLSSYYQRWAFRHPGTEDFIAIVSEKAGEQAAKFLKECITQPATLDYAIGGVKRVQTENGSAWQIRIDRRGELSAGVDIVVVDKAGQPKFYHWDGQGRYKKLIFTGDLPISVQVDPEETLPMDVNRLNNYWSAEPNWWATIRWSLVIVGMYQVLLAVGL